jgi:hypothetical protein
MASEESISLARKALALYDARLKSTLETSNSGDFVAIEPESGEYFLGQSLSEAIQAARAVYPERIPFTLRVGHKATVRLGVLS